MSRQDDVRPTMTLGLSHRRLGICLLLALAWMVMASAGISGAFAEDGEGQSREKAVPEQQTPEQDRAEHVPETVGKDAADSGPESASEPADAEQPSRSTPGGAAAAGAQAAAAESLDDRSRRVESAVAEALADSEGAARKPSAEESTGEPAADQAPGDARRQQLTKLVEQAPATELEGDEAYLAVLSAEVAETLVRGPAKPADDARAAADDQSPEETAAGEYRVRAGDSLWAIAEAQLGDGNRWPAVYEANREILKDENFLRVGQLLKLPDD